MNWKYGDCIPLPHFSFAMILLLLLVEQTNGSCVVHGAIKNPRFQCTYQQDGYTRPCDWSWKDHSTGYNDVHSLDIKQGTYGTYDTTTEKSNVAGTNWVANDFDNNEMVLEQTDVCLSGNTLVHTIVGGKPGDYDSADRSNHKVYIDDNEVKNCGYVTPNEVKPCEVDINSYSGKHTLKFTWEQRTDDNLGSSGKADFKILHDGSRCSTCSEGVMVSPQSCDVCCYRNHECTECAPSPIPTNTSTLTRTRTPSKTPTPTNTRTPSNTGTRTRTPTLSKTTTSTPTPTRSETMTRTPSHTHTKTQTETRTPTTTKSLTRTPSSTRTPSQTSTGTVSATMSPTSSSSPSHTGTCTPTYAALATMASSATRTGRIAPDRTGKSISTAAPSSHINPSAATETRRRDQQNRVGLQSPDSTQCRNEKLNLKRSSCIKVMVQPCDERKGQIWKKKVTRRERASSQ
eukprot:gb/GECG01007018.1/.p1 GENE.gb/GECG01007018.1/~~gb/GECG01007018.1/.p1  ORF type:complete len:458 (+),score=23.95 gb/GECG01007018.1/:1-1374(+)